MRLPLHLIRPRKFAEHFRRLHRARRPEIQFKRRENFQLLDQIFIVNRFIPIDLLDEGGSKADFIGIFLDNMYMIEALKGVRSIIDVGVNQGLFAMYARTLFPEATIHAYEPNPTLSQLFQKHCVNVNAEAFVEAVGLVDGMCSLDFLGDSNLTRARVDGRGKIRMTPISRAIDRIGSEIDLLKLDCEGFEWDILRATEAIRRVRYVAWNTIVGPMVLATRI